jgi:hypothetical protein
MIKYTCGLGAIALMISIHIQSAEKPYYTGWDVVHHICQQDDFALRSRNAGRESAIVSHLMSLNKFGSSDIDSQLKALVYPVTDESYSVYKAALGVIKDTVEQAPQLSKKDSLDVCRSHYASFAGIVKGVQDKILGKLYPSTARRDLIDAHCQRLTDWSSTATAKDFRTASKAEQKGVVKLIDFMHGFFDHHKRSIILLTAGAYLGLLNHELVCVNSPEYALLQDKSVRDSYDSFWGKESVRKALNFALDFSETPVKEDHIASDDNDSQIAAAVETVLNCAIAAESEPTVLVSKETDAGFDVMMQKRLDGQELSEQEQNAVEEFFSTWAVRLEEKNKRSDELGNALEWLYQRD